MKDEFNVAKILSDNPQVDMKLVEKAFELVKQASEMGIQPEGHIYVLPYQNTVFSSLAKRDKENT